MLGTFRRSSRRIGSMATAGGLKNDPSEGPPPDERRLEELQDALRKVLASNSFAGSRRLRQLLSYLAQAAMDGRTDLTQYEIAEELFHRSEDFNPSEDASVRKLVSHLRRKLDEYYATEGRNDPTLISLPSRSYLPRIRSRAPTLAAAPVAAGLTAPSRPYFIGFLLGLLPLLLAAALWSIRSEPGRTFPPGAAAIRTARGDICGPGLDIAPGAVRLGPPIGPSEEFTGAMAFAPEYPTQQAGIMAFDGPDRFVRLGRHFKTRALIEFGIETAGAYRGPESWFEFDLHAQRGSFRWFTIRRLGNRYVAFVSPDGFDWRPFGGPLEHGTPGLDPLAAIYAFNGRTDNPAAEAVFHSLGVGPSFHHRAEGPLNAGEFAGWRTSSGCTEPPDARIRGDALETGFSPRSMNCIWTLSRETPQSDWSFSTLLDFVPAAGSSAGLRLEGAQGSVSISRRDLGGGSILMELPHDDDARIPDFRGLPPLFLRLRLVKGTLSASVSRDGERFLPIPREVSAAKLGALRRIGIFTSVAHWASPGERPPARFYRIQQDVETLAPLPGSASGGGR